MLWEAIQSDELKFLLRLDYRREQKCLPNCRHTCQAHWHWKPLLPKPAWQQLKLLYGACNFRFGYNVFRGELVGKKSLLVSISIQWHHSKITRFWFLEVMFHLWWEWLFWWLLKGSYLKSNHQKTHVYPRAVGTWLLCKIGNVLTKYKETFFWSKRRLFAQSFFHICYESGCTNFKIIMLLRPSFWGVFSAFLYLNLSFISQFILPWKRFTLFCMIVFSNRAVLLFACCVCVSSCYHCTILILAAAIYADTLGTGTDYDCWEWKRWVRAAHEWLAEQRVTSLRDSESDRQFKFEGKTVVRRESKRQI